MKKQERINALVLIVDGKRIPKYIRLYDNGGKTTDRYTVVFTGNYKGRGGYCYYIHFSEAPNSPQGVYMRNQGKEIIDYPTYSYLGKKMKFQDLPQICRQVLMDEYCDLWGLPKEFVAEI